VFSSTAATVGWIADHLKAFDFAGCTVVHVTPRERSWPLALLLGTRVRLPKESVTASQPADCAARAVLLWFGWFRLHARLRPRGERAGRDFAFVKHACRDRCGAAR